MKDNKKVKHIALEIFKNDLEDFYKNILKGVVVDNKKLPKEVVRFLFGIEMEVEVYMVKCSGVEFELFVYHGSFNKQFCHICLETECASQIYHQANSEGYFVKKWGDNQSPTYFLKDKNGNMFELKEKK